MTIDTARLRALAEAATPGPWFYNGYSAIFAREVPDPIDGLTFDEWAEKLDGGHSAERYGACPACETDRPTGCRYAAEWYRRDNGCVAGVPAAHGDTAIGKQAGNAAYIAAVDPQTVLALLDEIDRLRQWKAEAMQVLDEWETTWIAAGRPGRLGASMAASVRDEIERLRDERGLSNERTRNPFTGEWFERWVTPWEPVEGDGDA